MGKASPNTLLRQTLVSIQFLSRLPVYRLLDEAEPVDFAKCAYTFPLAGLIIGLPSAIVLGLSLTVDLTFWIAGVLAIATQIVATGALHEDGLADVADGFWGGGTRDRKLDMMRDSATGTYGTLALICTFSFRLALLIHTFSNFSILASLSIYIAFESLSRLAILSPWNALQPARIGATSDEEKPGLSERYGGPGLTDFGRAVICALPAMLVIVFVAGVWPALVSFVAGWSAVLIITRLAEHHIGGHTGDVLGATQQLSLLGLYLGLSVAI